MFITLALLRRGKIERLSNAAVRSRGWWWSLNFIACCTVADLVSFEAPFAETVGFICWLRVARIQRGFEEGLRFLFLFAV